MGQNVSKGVEKVMGPRVDVVLDPKDVLVERRGIVWNVDGTIRSCVFCDIASGEIREHPEHLTKVVYEDNLVVAFAPLKIAAKQHFLVIPRQHITHVGDLFANDITVMDRMRAVGTELLKKGNADVTPENIRFCFHVPPWNSIDHLHLHVIELPFNSMVDRMKFAEGKPWCAGFDKVHTWVSASPDKRDEDLPEPTVSRGRSPATIGEHKEQTHALDEEKKEPIFEPV